MYHVNSELGLPLRCLDLEEVYLPVKETIRSVGLRMFA